MLSHPIPKNFLVAPHTWHNSSCLQLPSLPYRRLGPSVELVRSGTGWVFALSNLYTKLLSSTSPPREKVSPRDCTRGMINAETSFSGSFILSSCLIKYLIRLWVETQTNCPSQLEGKPVWLYWRRVEPWTWRWPEWAWQLVLAWTCHLPSFITDHTIIQLDRCTQYNSRPTEKCAFWDVGTVQSLAITYGPDLM